VIYTFPAQKNLPIPLIFNCFNSLSTAIHIKQTGLLTKVRKGKLTAVLDIIVPVDKKNWSLFVIKVGKSVILW
jgi:hypothetical protein